MKEYCVTMPATMSIHAYVEADSKEQAIEKAFNAEFTLEIKGKNIEIGEFETHDIICRGNVLSAVLNEVEVEEV